LSPEEGNALNPWKAASADIEPDSDHVDVWRIPTQLDGPQLKAFESVLSAHQRERAARLRVDEKRRQYIVAQGLTRRILGRAVSASPQAVEFVRGPKGKPYLGGEAAAQGIQFNMTHTSHLALIAVTRRGEVGIDIERIRRNLAWEKLARRYFSAHEQAAFRAQPPDARLRAFTAAPAGKPLERTLPWPLVHDPPGTRRALRRHPGHRIRRRPPALLGRGSRQSDLTLRGASDMGSDM
jgi:4'-phosphopantetheinyl transferase